MFGVINCRKFLIGIHDYKGLNEIGQKNYREFKVIQRFVALLATDPLPAILCCLIKNVYIYIYFFFLAMQSY